MKLSMPKKIRLKNHHLKAKANNNIIKSISEKLHKKWSPEQIANTVCKDIVCFKTIYNWIYSKI